MRLKSKILIIAGSDSSGGAGIQADIKTVTSLGSYAMTAITAVTAQNTTGVKSIVAIKPNEISNQINFTAKDIKPDAIKIGMLHSTQIIHKVLKALNEIKTKKIDNVSKTTNENNYAYLIYTSGTTSIPKGVGITHSNALFTTNNIVNVLKYTSSDIDVMPLPLYHSFGLGCMHTTFFVGSTLILHQNATDLNQLADSISYHNASTFSSVPSTLSKLLETFSTDKMNDIFSNLRLIMTNSTSIPENTVKQFEQILKSGNLATYYGLTEASRSTFMIFDKKGLQNWWIGGGCDLTPFLPYKSDITLWHRSLKSMFDAFNKTFYKKFAKECDKYFEYNWFYYISITILNKN